MWFLPVAVLKVSSVTTYKHEVGSQVRTDIDLYLKIKMCVTVCFTYRTPMIRPIKKTVPKNPPIIRGTFNSVGDKTL